MQLRSRGVRAARAARASGNDTGSVTLVRRAVSTCLQERYTIGWREDGIQTAFDVVGVPVLSRLWEGGSGACSMRGTPLTRP